MPLRPLILPAEVGQLARPCYADEALLTQIIAESEREDIRPRIGATLFVALKSTESDADLTGLEENGPTTPAECTTLTVSR